MSQPPEALSAGIRSRALTRRGVFHLGLSFVLTVALLGYVVRHLDLNATTSALTGMRWSWFAASLLAFLSYQWVRALRLRLVLAERGPARPLFFTVCMQAFFNKLLPVWLGEVALVWLLRRLHAVSLLRGAAALVVMRVVDFCLYAVAFLVLVGLGIEWLPASFVKAGAVVSGVVVAIALGGGLALWWWSRGRRTPAPAAASSGVRASIARLLAELAQGWELLRTRAGLSAILLYSVGLWVAMGAYFVCVAAALDPTLPAAHVVTLYLLLFPVSILPVKGIANLGTHEATWFVCLRLLGVEPSRAAALAVGSHVLFFIGFGVAFAVGLAGTARWRAPAPVTASP